MKSEKSCRHEKLMGSQTPSDRIVPDYAYTDGPDAVKVLAVGKLIVDPWQSEVLNDWMGRTEDDVWSAPTCGLSVPRQNGKTLDTSGRIASGMILYAEWVIYTAHLQKTATETFMELRGLFESRGLRKYVKEIKAALGREQIILKNGGRVVFVARTRNGGRGLHGDCLVFDEAQELTSEQQASFLPAISASRNPQTIYLGTPPDENCTGTVFRKIRKRATEGESKSTAWTEYSVKEIGDVTDRQRWADCKPKALNAINQNTEKALKEYGVPSERKPTIVILADDELKNALGLYDPCTNTVYYSQSIAKQEIQKLAGGKDAVERHEMWHMKQAEEFRKVGWEITKENRSEYLKELCKKAKKNLDALGITQDNVSEISDYAYQQYQLGRYDETEAEYMLIYNRR